MIPLEGYTSIGGLSLRRFLDILADSFLARTYGNRALDGIAHFPLHLLIMGFPCGSDGKEFSCNAGDLDWEDPLEEGMATHSNILTWRIPMDRGIWWARVHGVIKSWT